MDYRGLPVTARETLSAKRPHASSGFTLVELMIVVAIIGIIAAFGYPAYRNYVIQAKRVDGQTLLMDLAARQERFYADNRAYATTAKDNLGYATMTAESAEGNWTAEVDSGGQAFVLIAKPAGDHAGRDPDCAFLGINNQGRKGGGKDKTAMLTWNRVPCWGS